MARPVVSAGMGRSTPLKDMVLRCWAHVLLKGLVNIIDPSKSGDRRACRLFPHLGAPYSVLRSSH